MAETIALTGATGFVGGALLKRLVTTGKLIKALIRPASAHKQPADGSTRWIKGDLEDVTSLRQLVRGADVIVHCAGVVRGATRKQFNRVNVDGVARLVQAASEQQPVPRFLLMSSLAAREPQLSDHAASKRQGERVFMEKSGRIGGAIFRPSAVYGPGDRELMPTFRWMAKGVAPLLGSGNSRFSLLYIEDLVDAVLHWLDQGRDQGFTYELHDGHPAGGYSWHEVIHTVARLRGAPVVRVRIPVVLAKLVAILNLAAARTIGYAPMLTPGKVRELCHSDWIGDNAALCRETGWSPQIQLAEGLRRTLGLENISNSENSS